MHSSAPSPVSRQAIGRRGRRVLVISAAIYAAVVLVLTFVPADLQKTARRSAESAGVVERPTSMKAARGQASRTDVVVNVAMLMPLAGAGAVVWAGAGRRVVLACAAFSACIELGQELLPTRRTGTLSDFGWNVAGAGAAVAAVWWARTTRSLTARGRPPTAGRQR